jgi:hypothetical protein
MLLSRQFDAKSSPRGAKALEGLLRAHGKRAGHSSPITDVVYSGDVLVTKDKASMRLWRAGGDYALLRVVTAPGKHVAFHHTGQFIVVGERGADTAKVFGPSGGSAVGAGRKNGVVQ